METYVSVTSEEWQMLKPQPEARSHKIVKQMKDLIKDEGRCGNCSGWTLKSTELVDLERGSNVVEVGLWEPKLGLQLFDDLFPHVSGGLRGRQLTVASNHVSNTVFENQLKCLIMNFCAKLKFRAKNEFSRQK